MRTAGWAILAIAMSEENVEIVKRIYADWARGEYRWTDWADPEIEFSVPGPEGVVHGVEGMTRAWTEWLRVFKGLTIEAIAFYDAEDTVVVEQAFHGQGKGSGISLDEISGGAVLIFRDGKVIRYAGYTTVEAALADAGLARSDRS
jgi:ketosteroid isomerase-like protein